MFAAPPEIKTEVFTLRRYAIRPHERFELNALEAIAVMVDRGLGVSLVPDWPLSWPAGHTLLRKPLPHPFAPRCVGLVWSRATPRLRLVQALLKTLRRRQVRTAGRCLRFAACSRRSTRLRRWG